MENDSGKKTIIYKGTITTISGMLIGGPESEVQIGGIDKVPIQHKGEPYIPGSSLKGKLRSLLEIKYKDDQDFDSAGFCKNPSHPIGKLFGTPGGSISRIIVRDAFLNEECRREVLRGTDDTERFYEVKTETAIDRNKGTAKRRSLRTIKRTIPGLKFDFEILLFVENEKEEKELTRYLEEAFSLLNQSYLGSSGTRGYGQVKFEVKFKERKPLNSKEREAS